MDTALVDGYPRRQRRQVTASYYTLLCISIWFWSWDGVEGSFEGARAGAGTTGQVRPG